ncbi:hypothetical protein OIU79_031227 [Salix purpurea]|uniref:Uncharacterized protein n=1 Tax=Salix purpurea TaxID=77065 RepID=A0A9Q0VAB1_SALPP|nr:hypothetical protein OIU79_031227 [Salix purpurea]
MDPRIDGNERDHADEVAENANRGGDACVDVSRHREGGNVFDEYFDQHCVSRSMEGRNVVSGSEGTGSEGAATGANAGTNVGLSDGTNMGLSGSNMDLSGKGAVGLSGSESSGRGAMGLSGRRGAMGLSGSETCRCK